MTLADLKRDKDGYLMNPCDWNSDIALELAKEENINLTPEHWELITFVQQFYQQYNTTPAIRLLVKSVAKQFGAEKGNSIYLYKLFPNGPAKQISKIAGLPKPVKCI